MTRNTCNIPGCTRLVHGHGYCRSHYMRWRRNGDPLAGVASKGEGEAWLREYANYVGDDCLTWPYGRSGNGYAYVDFEGTRMPASRAMCTLVNGEAPSPDHEAAHSCGLGNEACVSPQHLRWATSAENKSDQVLHGTSNRGERCGVSKLTERDVRVIKSNNTSTGADLAERFGVSRSAIYHIRRGINWGWLNV